MAAQDELRIYYKRLFPYEPFFKWLEYGSIDKNYLQNREFSFTLDDDVYIRYQSYSSRDEFEKEVQTKIPNKIDIGAIYSMRPKDHRMRAQFQPLEKEMVFDIDMTDYDEVRTCCSGADVCAKCWKFLAIACKILDVAIEEDFAWKHKLWVFSGRRGIHCWICDESARKLDVPQRSAVAEYLQVLSGGEKQYKKISLHSDIIHPSIKRALEIIDEYFEKAIVIEQDILGSNKEIVKFLKMIPDEELKNSAEMTFKDYNTSLERWNAFKDLVLFTNKQHSFKRRSTKYIIEEIKLQYAYPRLDINVSKGLNHLLKSPFCIHPKTGKVCIPFSARNVDSFDPSEVPTLKLLLKEIDEYDAKRKELDVEVRIKDFKKTSLIACVKIFEEFLKPMEQEWREKIKEREAKKLEF